jgi:hypothetical protein
MRRPTHTKKSEAEDEPDDPSIDVYYPWLKLSKETHLLFFDLEGDTPQKRELTAKIAILDHKAMRRLSPPSPAWDEVNKQLLNVIISAHEERYAEAKTLLKDAEGTYHLHNQARNRRRYLMGFLAGTVAAVVLGYAIILLLNNFDPQFDVRLLAEMFLFAGIGSVVSALTRIQSVDLREETSNFDIILSGAARPLVSIFFSLVVYMILAIKAVNINVGNNEANPNFLFFIAAFMCGFTERFAEDIIARLPFAKPDKSGESH